MAFPDLDNYTSNLAYLKPPDTSSQAGFETWQGRCRHPQT